MRVVHGLCAWCVADETPTSPPLEDADFEDDDGNNADESTVPVGASMGKTTGIVGRKKKKEKMMMKINGC